MNEQPENQIPRHRIRAAFVSLFGSAVLGAGALILGAFALNAPPTDFPVNADIEIVQGSTLTDIAQVLGERGVVASPKLFQLIATFRNVGHTVYAGVYRLPETLSTTEVVEALTTDAYLLPPVRITIPEGATLNDIDQLAQESLGLPKGAVIAAHNGVEGGLFPDTYFMDRDTTAEELVALLKKTQDDRLLPLRPMIQSSGFTEAEVVILASIIEKEANDDESMAMVSGILQKRLEIDMPLQVDATFAYLLHKESRELTEDDLTMDSPLNTYNNRGLPPQAIGNPGLRAINAVLAPKESEYLYYLSDSEGEFYYATTFDEHKINKARYLQ